MLRDPEQSRVRDRAKIRELMHAHMKDPKKPWLVEIFTREHRRGGDIFEGARVVSAVTEGESGETTYQIAIGNKSWQLKLSLIEYIVVL